MRHRRARSHTIHTKKVWPGTHLPPLRHNCITIAIQAAQAVQGMPMPYFRLSLSLSDMANYSPFSPTCPIRLLSGSSLLPLLRHYCITIATQAAQASTGQKPPVPPFDTLRTSKSGVWVSLGKLSQPLPVPEIEKHSTGDNQHQPQDSRESKG